MASTGSPMQWRVAILHDSGVSLHTTTIRPASRTLLVAFAMLPFASNAKHTGVWPFFAAKCSGVQPCARAQSAGGRPGLGKKRSGCSGAPHRLALHMLR